MIRATLLSLSSYAVDCIQKLNTRQQSLTRGGGAGQGNIFSSTHSTRTTLHTKGQQTERQWKVIEVKVIQLSTAAQ